MPVESKSNELELNSLSSVLALKERELNDFRKEQTKILEEQWNSLQDENSRLMENRVKIKTDFEYNLSIISEQKSEISKLEQMMLSFQKVLKEKDVVIKQLNSDIAKQSKVQEKVSKLEFRLKSVQDELFTKREDHVNLKNAHEKLNLRFKEKNKMAKLLSKRTNGLRENMLSLKHFGAQVKEMNSSKLLLIHENVKKIVASIKRHAIKSNSKVLDLKSRMKLNDATVNSLRKDLELKHQEMNRLTLYVNQLEAESKINACKHEVEVKAKASALHKMTINLNAITKEREDYKVKLHAMNDDCKNLTQEIKTLKTQLSEVENRALVHDEERKLQTAKSLDALNHTFSLHMREVVSEKDQFKAKLDNLLLNYKALSLVHDRNNQSNCAPSSSQPELQVDAEKLNNLKLSSQKTEMKLQVAQKSLHRAKRKLTAKNDIIKRLENCCSELQLKLAETELALKSKKVEQRDVTHKHDEYQKPDLSTNFEGISPLPSLNLRFLTSNQEQQVHGVEPNALPLPQQVPGSTPTSRPAQKIINLPTQKCKDCVVKSKDFEKLAMKRKVQQVEFNKLKQRFIRVREELKLTKVENETIRNEKYVLSDKIKEMNLLLKKILQQNLELQSIKK